MAQRIGFIGIGLMGYGIARNLLEKGHPLVVMANRSRERVLLLPFAPGCTFLSHANVLQANGDEDPCCGRTGDVAD